MTGDSAVLQPWSSSSVSLNHQPINIQLIAPIQCIAPWVHGAYFLRSLVEIFCQPFLLIPFFVTETAHIAKKNLSEWKTTLNKETGRLCARQSQVSASHFNGVWTNRPRDAPSSSLRPPSNLSSSRNLRNQPLSYPRPAGPANTIF